MSNPTEESEPEVAQRTLSRDNRRLEKKSTVKGWEGLDRSSARCFLLFLTLCLVAEVFSWQRSWMLNFLESSALDAAFLSSLALRDVRRGDLRTLTLSSLRPPLADLSVNACYEDSVF